MKNPFFEKLEALNKTDQVELAQCIEHLRFNTEGLICVVTQEFKSREILMQAWMNKTAIEKTLATKRVTYWSRSRQSLWVKGESSGHYQILQEMRFDCDGDSVLCLVEQIGPACHTLRPSCFYLQVNMQSNQVQLCASDQARQLDNRKPEGIQI